MREFRTSGSVGAPASNRRGDPTTLFWMPLKKPKLLRQIRSFLIWGDSNRSRQFAMRLLAESGARTAASGRLADIQHLLPMTFA